MSMIVTLPAPATRPPADVRPAIVAVGWVPQAVEDRDRYYYRWQLAEGLCEDRAAEIAALVAEVGALREALADADRLAEARLARLGGRPRPSLAVALVAALWLGWLGLWDVFETDASRRGLRP